MESVAFSRTYRVAIRSFYKHIALMLLVFVCACVISWKALLGASITWGAALILILAIFANILMKRASEKLTLRDNEHEKEIAYETGFANTRSVEIELGNIKHIEVEQNVLQKLLGIGDMKIASSGTSENEIHIRNIPNPYVVRNEIQEHTRKYSYANRVVNQ